MFPWQLVQASFFFRHADKQLL